MGTLNIAIGSIYFSNNLWGKIKNIFMKYSQIMHLYECVILWAIKYIMCH